MHRLVPRSYVLTACLVAAFAFASCDGGTGPETISVSVSPSTATVGAGDAQSFTATVSNAMDGSVTWTASAGTLSGTGPNAVTWTAPVAGGSATVTATSAEDASASASATVTVTSVSVAVSPDPGVLFRGEEVTFTADVSGTSQTGVTWASTCGTATPSGSTLTYTAPTTVGESCDITATSDLDGSAVGSVQIAVRGEFLVTAGDDVDDGACDITHCSIREALNAANAAVGLDTILLDAEAGGSIPGSHRLAFGGPPTGSAGVETLNPTEELPVITDDLLIFGEGSDVTEIDLAASVSDMRRAFDIDGAIEVTIGGLTIRNGVSNGFGGAIRVRGGAHLIADDVHLLDNQANGGEGGGLALLGAGTRATLTDAVIDGNRTLLDATVVRPGGGITLTAGTELSMVGGSISNNVVEEGWGGAIRAIDFVSLTLDGVTIDGNEALEAASGYAGAIHTELAGDLSITGSTLSNNRAAVDGGALRLIGTGQTSIDDTDFVGNEAQFGGALLLSGSVLDMTNVSFRQNNATDGGGALWLVDATVTASGTDFIENTGAVHSGAVIAGGSTTLTLDGSTLDGNMADFAGALNVVATSALTLTNSVVSNNQSRTGSAGALATQNTATLDVSDTDFFGNQSAVAGGAMWITAGLATLDRVTVRDNTAGTNGGGMTAASTVGVTVSNSTFSGNTSGAGGGAILTFTSPVTIANSTFSGNAAEVGGGVYGLNVVDVTNSTFVGNSGTVSGGGGVWASGLGVVTLANTLLSGNTGPSGDANCTAQGTGVITSDDGNLSDDATCTTLTEAADQNDVSAGVDTTLGDNGGPTSTHALLEGSAAINVAVTANCPTTDQRGAARVGTCDIGAVEFGSAPPAVGPGRNR